VSPRADDSQVEEVLEALEDHFSDQLTPWEFDFVASVREQWDERKTLTEKQRTKLDQIFERFARGGGR